MVDTGEAALALLTATPSAFDLVVLDVMLPGKDGFDGRLRAAPGEPVRSRPDADRARPPEDVLRGFAAGADDYLPKPFELAILMARIRGLLRRREWLQRPHAGIRIPASSWWPARRSTSTLWNCACGIKPCG